MYVPDLIKIVSKLLWCKTWWCSSQHGKLKICEMPPVKPSLPASTAIPILKGSLFLDHFFWHLIGTFYPSTLHFMDNPTNIWLHTCACYLNQLFYYFSWHRAKTDICNVETLYLK